MAGVRPADIRFPRTYEELLVMPELATAEILYRGYRGYRVIVRLTPGVVMKYGGEFGDEILSMKLARAAGLPVPAVIHHPGSLDIRYAWDLKTPLNVWYFCMDNCPGIPLSKVVDQLSDDKLAALATQLRDILDRLSSVKHTGTIGSVDGKAFQTLPGVPPHRQPEQPFRSVAEFNEFLGSLYSECVGPPRLIAANISRLPTDASIQFTHGCLVPKHIMVDAGGERITGILDWGSSGFYPSYWEYCRMHNPNYMTPGWEKILSQVFPEPKRTKEINAVRDMLTAIDIQL